MNKKITVYCFMLLPFHKTFNKIKTETTLEKTGKR